MKNKNDYTDDVKRERNMTRLSVISLIAGSALVLSLFIAAMLHVGLISPPDFIKKWLDDGSVELPEDMSRLYYALEGNVDDEITVTHAVSDADVLPLLEKTPPYTCYSAVMRVVTSSSDGSLVKIVRLWRDEDRSRAEVYDKEGALMRTVVCDAVNISISDFNGGETTLVYGVGDDFSVENSVGVLDIMYVRDIILNGGAELSIAHSPTETLYLAKYTRDGLPAQSERIFISLKYGLIVCAESVCDGTNVYTLTLESIQNGIVGYNGDDIFAVRDATK